jgi:methylglutaconyl-CoA hydratase
MKNLVKIKVHAPSGTIILDRPEKRNAMSRLMMLQMKQAFEDLHQERRVRAVIITGAGDCFSAGSDLAEISSTFSTDDAFEQWHRDTVQFKDLLEMMLRFPKPIIAAVNGPAVAAGAGLILASDIVVATPEASYGFPESRRGLVAGTVSPLLAFRVGAGPAANLLLTARLIEAQDALGLNIYHQIVPMEQAWAMAHEIASQCAKSARESLQMTKRMLNETVGEQLNTLLAAGAAISAAARTTEAATEGVAAFLEKRDPKWP